MDAVRDKARICFAAIYLDKGGTLDRNELSAVHGGDSTGLLHDLKETDDQQITSEEWMAWIERLVASKGQAAAARLLEVRH